VSSASAESGSGTEMIVPNSGPSGTRTPLSSVAPAGIIPVTRITAMQTMAMRRRVLIAWLMMAQRLRDGNFGFALWAGVAELADAQDLKLAGWDESE
jgi:hypothetical protein